MQASVPTVPETGVPQLTSATLPGVEARRPGLLRLLYKLVLLHGKIARGCITALLPRALRKRLEQAQGLRLIRNYLYDMTRYRRWSACGGQLSRTNLRARITMGYHAIEKGMSLKDPRAGFGNTRIDRLLRDLSDYLCRYGADETAQIAMDALASYQRFNIQQGCVNHELDQMLAQIKSEIDAPDHGREKGGVIELTRDEVQAAGRIDLEPFFMSRHSVRQFSPDPVDMALIEKALRMAQRTPSVCNRQAWKVYVFTDDRTKQKILELQNGNRGFGEQIGQLLIVTCDLSWFVSVGERNQAWIDGGMYCMSLVYALHSLGLGTCCLNASTEYGRDERFREVASVPDSEVVIMMIAVGNLPQRFYVARSPRKSLREVLVLPETNSAMSAHIRGGP